jgi:hypothetical protein
MVTINTSTLLIIVFIGWMLYSLLQSYYSIEKELQDLREKCGVTTISSPSMRYPLKNIRSSVVSGLSQLL